MFLQIPARPEKASALRDEDSEDPRRQDPRRLRKPTILKTRMYTKSRALSALPRWQTPIEHGQRTAEPGETCFRNQTSELWSALWVCGSVCGMVAGAKHGATRLIV